MNENLHGGDPIDGNETVRRTERKRRRPSLLLLLAVFSMLSLAVSAYSAYRVEALGSAQQFPGVTPIQIVATYSLGAAPSGSVGMPGSSINFTLQVTSNPTNAGTIAIFFNATDPSDWSQTYPSSVGSTCGPINGLLTMTVGSQQIAPMNASPTTQSGATCAPVTQALVPVAHGLNVIKGTIAISASAPIGLSFSLNWFGQAH